MPSSHSCSLCDDPHQPAPYTPWAAGAGFFVGGLVILLPGALAVLEARRAQSWPSVQGTFRGIHLACGRHVCTPVANYVYRVPDPSGSRDTGRVYAGTRITFADGGMSHGDQVLVLHRYRGGASVQVFYDPR